MTRLSGKPLTPVDRAIKGWHASPAPCNIAPTVARLYNLRTDERAAEALLSFRHKLVLLSKKEDEMRRLDDGVNEVSDALLTLTTVLLWVNRRNDVTPHDRGEAVKAAYRMAKFGYSLGQEMPHTEQRNHAHLVHLIEIEKYEHFGIADNYADRLAACAPLIEDSALRARTYAGFGLLLRRKPFSTLCRGMYWGLRSLGVRHTSWRDWRWCFARLFAAEL